MCFEINKCCQLTCFALKINLFLNKNWVFYFYWSFCFVIETLIKCSRFFIKSCNFNYYCFILFIAIWAMSMIMTWFIIFKTTIIFSFFIFACVRLFCANASKLLSDLLFFKTTKMTKFVRLLISIKLMLEEFIAF